MGRLFDSSDGTRSRIEPEWLPHGLTPYSDGVTKCRHSSSTAATAFRGRLWVPNRSSAAGMSSRCGALT